MHTSPVTSLDKKLDVGIHKWNRHCDSRPIWEDEIGVLAEALDDAEDVIPSTTVETRAVVA